MYGNYTNSGIVTLPSYEKALKWFNDTPPIRGKGRNAGVKPLGHRDRPHFQIHKREGEAIACRLYDTDVVTFYPDGRIIIKTLGYITQTTTNFIGDVLGIPAYVQDKSVQILVNGCPYRLKVQIVLRRNEEGRLQVEQAEQYYTYHVNRKAKKDALTKVAPFEAYIRQQMKVRDLGKFEGTEKEAMFEELGLDPNDNYVIWELDLRMWRENVDTAALRHKKLVELARSDDIGNWYLAIRWLAFSQARWTNTVHTAADHLIDALHVSVMAITPSIFSKIEVPKGMVKKNRYAMYAPFIEEAAKWDTSTPT